MISAFKEAYERYDSFLSDKEKSVDPDSALSKPKKEIGCRSRTVGWGME